MKPESETESATMAGWQRATDPETGDKTFYPLPGSRELLVPELCSASPKLTGRHCTGKTFLFNEKGETKWETVTEAGQEKTTEEEVTSTFLGTKNFVSDGGDWFAKTTEADRAQRVGGDPLAPLKSGGMTRKEKEDRMVGIERDSTNWYKNQETKRSMFGRTLNPLTGSLQDIKDTDNVETLNPLEVLFAVKHAPMPHVLCHVPVFCPRHASNSGRVCAVVDALCTAQGCMRAWDSAQSQPRMHARTHAREDTHVSTHVQTRAAGAVTYAMPTQDPIFYVLVIVGAPFLLMLYAGTQCYVYALSLAFGIECPASY